MRAGPPSQACSTRPTPCCSRSRPRSAPLLRASRATPIEIAAFPVEMNAAARPVSEFAILALGGLLHMVGEPERKPLRLGGHQASYAAGLTAFTGLTAALAARDAGQTAPDVRVSLAEVMQWVNWKAASGADAGGISPGREGKNSEFQIVPCRDGHVAVVYTVTQWPATRALIGDPRLGDPKFNTRAGRRENIAELYEIITPWFADKTRAEIQKTAQAKGVPFGPIFSPAELLADRAVCRARLPGRHGPSDTRHAATAATARAVERPLLRAAARTGIRGMKALAGVRVLDFGLLTAGANTSAMLADLGADVIKIESGAYLDPFRVVGKPDNDDGWWNRSPQFRFTNRNKRGLALNLKDPEGQRVIRELAAPLRRRGREFPPRRARPRGPRLQGPERDQSAPRVRRHLEPGRHRAGAHERLVRHRRSTPPRASPPSPATRARSRASRAWT